MSDLRVDPDAPEVYRDLRGLEVDPKALPRHELATVGGRLLTYEQVRMLRDLWVCAAIADGYTDTAALAITILGDQTTSALGLRATDLFMCDPTEDDEEELVRGVEEQAGPAPDERARQIAKALGGSLRRLVRERYVKMDHAAA